MELRHLRYFLAIAETQHFSKAADLLNITQPTLSQQIRNLEDEIGTPLFDRLGRRVGLTEAGRIFEESAKRALLEVKWGQQQIDELLNLQHGTLRIGAIHTFNTSLVTPIVAAFYSRHPGIRISVEEDSTQGIANSVSLGKLDMGIAFSHSQLPEIEIDPLFEEEFVLAVRNDHPLAALDSMAFEKLQDVPLILVNEKTSTRRMINEFFAEAGIETTVHVETSTFEVIMQIIAQSKLAGIVPGSIKELKDDLFHTIHLVEPTPVRRASLLYHRYSYKSAATKAFAEFFKDSIRDGANG